MSFIFADRMKLPDRLHTTNYFNTFIEVALDCPVKHGEVPPDKGLQKTVAQIQFEILEGNPYKYTSDDVLFAVYAERKDITGQEMKAAKEEFFSKGQACLRSSPLAKRYGWGFHSNSEGTVALYGCETTEYRRLLRDKSLKVVKAMKTRR
jgi:hypothetical protein